MSGLAEVVLAGVDPARVEVQEREILGPHIFVRCEDGLSLSIIGEIDVDALVRSPPRPDPRAQLPLAAGEVEIGLLSAERGLIADPLRHVPFAAAAAVCRLALAGNVDAFRPLYTDEEGDR